MVDILRFFAGLASEVKGKTIPWTPGRFLYTKRVPVGVVGAIIPWNAPLMQTACKIGPALAAGNTVVLKTAEQAPLAVLRVLRTDAGSSAAGVANVISGFGEEAGKPLVEHPLVRKVTFTGSSAVGVQIMHYAADKFISGHSRARRQESQHRACPMPISIWRYPASSRGCVCSARASPAQPAPASTFTRTSIAKSSIDVVAEIGKGRLGNPLDDSTEVGAVISAEQLARIERYVEMARQTPGARILVGGERPGAMRRCGAATSTSRR